MTQYRDHRGSLDDSLATLRELHTFDDLVHHLNATCLGFEVRPSAIDIKPYLADGRIGWLDQHIVTVAGFGVVGFTDGPFAREARHDD